MTCLRPRVQREPRPHPLPATFYLPDSEKCTEVRGVEPDDLRSFPIQMLMMTEEAGPGLDTLLQHKKACVLRSLSKATRDQI